MAGQCAESLLVCHGIVEEEGPKDHFTRLAFTSEEVRDHWRCIGRIIRQPIDLDFWSPGPRKDARTMVRYAARGGLEWLPEVARELRLPFVHVRNATPEQARDALRGAAVVLASGRCAVEAMACGAPVVICDERGYQGALLDPTGVDAMARNYSGRGGVAPTPELVAAAVRDAIERGSAHAHANQHHDARKIVASLLEMAR